MARAWYRPVFPFRRALPLVVASPFGFSIQEEGDLRMSYNRSHARRLCNRTELSLFEASLADAIRGHTPAQLQSKIARTRTLRDKYRDLHRRQSLKTRARTGAKHGHVGTSDQRTQQKARLFEEALDRLQARAGQLQKAEERKAAAARAAAAAPARKKTRKKTTRTAARSSAAEAKKARGARTAKGHVGEGAQAAAHARKLASSRSRPIQAHVGARNRRAQAKRDSR